MDFTCVEKGIETTQRILMLQTHSFMFINIANKQNSVCQYFSHKVEEKGCAHEQKHIPRAASP